jgi:hypothetical protein
LRWLVPVLLVAAAARAQAPAPRPLVIAILTPTTPFESPAQRFDYVQRLASALSRAGMPAVGKAFARSADLDAQVARGQIDYAVLDVGAQVERAHPCSPVAVGSLGGHADVAWRLYVHPSLAAAVPADLTGRRLAHPSARGGAGALFETAALDQVVDPARFFAKRVAAPNLSSAIATVALGKADAVFAPDGHAPGLRAVGPPLGRLPLPALCRVSARALPAPAQVVAALAQVAHPGVIDGFRSAGTELYEQLPTRLTTGHRPMLVEPDWLPLQGAQVTPVTPVTQAAQVAQAVQADNPAISRAVALPELPVPLPDASRYLQVE